MARRVAAILLAAGRSTRCAPRNKLLMPMPDGRALIAHTARQALASQAGIVITVTGFQAELVRAALAGLGLEFVHAADFAAGLAASLRAGIAALPAETEAALIMLGDMPLVAPALLDALIAAYNPDAGKDIIVPVWQGQRGNPRVLGRRYFTDMKSLTGDAGAARLLQQYPARIAEIPAPDDAVLRDFDTPRAFAGLS